jgi:hypothetical protein
MDRSYVRPSPNRAFMFHIGAFWVLLSSLIICQPFFAQTSQTGSLTLPGGSKFKTTLYELKLIGTLRTEHKLPYYVLSGVGCQECDANRSIYIHSPSDGPMKNEGEQRRFLYPGKETNYEDGTLWYEARMFFGECLAAHPNSVVWFERSRGDDKQWREDVLLAEVKGDRLVTERVQRELPKVSEAEDAVRAGHCHEVPGIKRSSEP